MHVDSLDLLATPVDRAVQEHKVFEVMLVSPVRQVSRVSPVNRVIWETRARPVHRGFAVHRE